MKILLLSASLNFGGVETGTVDLAKSLKKLGQDVIVVSYGGQLVRELEESNIKHIKLDVYKKSLTAFLQVPKLARIIKDENIDIVHAQSRMPAWIAYFACKKTKAIFITSCHGYYSRHFFSRVMGWGRKVIAISGIIGKHMREKFAVNPEKIRLVYRGVDLTKYLYQKDKYSRPKDKFIIVNISRITPIKGQREFIKAIAIVVRKISNIEVWLVGAAAKKNRHYEIELHQLVRELNLGDKVKFLGGRKDVPQILSDADLLVLSTNVAEAFGRVIIEAGASGVAVCASNIGGISEIVDDKKDGLLFSVNDENSMVQSIITMLSNPDLMRQYSANLRKKVEEKFSLEEMAQKTLEVYRESIENKKILVIKLGGLGDLILAMPSLRMLKKRFPRANISLLIDSNFQSLAKNCPYIDELILFDRKKDGFLRLVKDLKFRDFDLCIDFKNSNFTHMLAYLARVPLRYGFSRGLTASLLNCPERLTKDLAEKPVEQQYRILKRIGVRDFDDTLELWPSRQDEDFINSILEKKGISVKDKLIGLAIGASPKWPTKNWPVDNFSKLSEKLIANGFKVILLGTDYLSSEINKFPKDERIISFIGETNLNQLVSLIKRLNALVTPDSAPMHIASATKTKVIALFGPTDPERHIPPSKNIEVLVKHIACQPCYSRKCINKEKMACLNKISVEEVFDAIIKVPEGA
ncbi:MAG: lipopolysaccharide heptosyltransferase II [Candidatus Omnitrophica bacterium]|nr:lipopolysaccharide heptosyltransferase II [Candidatus Omnitrophota bacterium]MDD5352127.1 lipopolysaccharide heptosyltransferase II [Candidatus Omnitrophota bacterium]MDD5549725.1 lipopolysaccharide heptosyltransferase II [Candidatus Omnitrophota bacterium]